MSQNDLLPRDYQSARNVLPHPLALPPGLIPGDGETTAEMLLKVSLTGIIRDHPERTIERLINHLVKFPVTCKSLNREFLNRVQNEIGIFYSETS